MKPIKIIKKMVWIILVPSCQPVNCGSGKYGDQKCLKDTAAYAGKNFTFRPNKQLGLIVIEIAVKWKGDA
jgi:hypothetical protein